MLCSQVSARRLTRTQAHLLALLRQNSTITYEQICERLDIDRKTAFAAVRRLEQRGLVVKVSSRGRRPNRYLVTDHVVRWN